MNLLKTIKAYFNDVGIISESNKENMCAFRVSSPKHILEHILPHFEKYPLIPQKRADYILLKKNSWINVK